MSRKHEQPRGKPTSAAEEAEESEAPPARGAETDVEPDEPEEEIEHGAVASAGGMEDVERAVTSPSVREDIESGVPVERGWDISPDDVESGAPGKLASDMNPDDLD